MTFDSENLREAFGKALVEIGEQDHRVIVLDADLNTSTGTNLFRDRFPLRFIQCGVAEADLVAIAAGLASEGFITFPSTFAAFATRKALDQVFLNVCYPKLDVKIPGSYVGITATECGPSHNVVEDLAVMRSLPHIRVAAPGDSREMRSLIRSMVDQPGPVYFRVEKAEAVRLFDDGYTFQWGVSHVLREGSDVSLFGTGVVTGLLLGAAELLARKGISAEVVHFPSIKPMDDEGAARSVRRTGCVLTCENGRAAAGFGGAVAESLARTYPVRIDMAGVRDEPVESAPLSHLLREYALTPAALAARAERLLRSKRVAA